MGGLLRDHPRLARLLESGARRALAVAEPDNAQVNGQPPAQPAPVAPEPSPPEGGIGEIPPDLTEVFRPIPGVGTRYARTAEVSWLANEEFVCTTRLYERLSPSDRLEIEALIDSDPELAEIWASKLDPGSRKVMTIAYGIWLGHPAATAATGLSTVQPPEEVHAMARGPLSAAGGLYEADIVANALASVGVDIATLRDGLDFGCSSGRVLRVLAAAYPELSWHGCDPNGAAIAWARAHLPGIDFFASPIEPPLELAGASLDLVLAFSIWSHFAPALGLRWLDEMHRLIRPGGHLVLTTHGATSISYYAVRQLRSVYQCDEIVAELYRRGCWYAPEFGAQGDWGVSSPEWGSAFLSSEWLLSELCPRWHVVEFAPGRNQYNQDVYVLRRA